MAGSVNKVILLGNLGRDPDIRTMQNGKKVCSFSIATSDSWKDKETGEKKEKTEWQLGVRWFFLNHYHWTCLLYQSIIETPYL